MGTRSACPLLVPLHRTRFADTGYQGPKSAAAIAKSGTWKLKIVKRNELSRFVVLLKRWILSATRDPPPLSFALA
jgi:transposase